MARDFAMDMWLCMLFSKACILVLFLTTCSTAVVGNDKLEADFSITSRYELLRHDAVSGGAEEKLVAFLFVVDNSDALKDKIEESLEFLLISAATGNSEAQFNLGFMLQTGTWLTQDRDGAVPWLTLSSEQGNEKAQFLLGSNYFTRFYAEGESKTKLAYLNLSVKWLRLASNADVVEAMTMLGQILAGRNESCEEGMLWLNKAAVLGDEKAVLALGEIGGCD